MDHGMSTYTELNGEEKVLIREGREYKR